MILKMKVLTSVIEGGIDKGSEASISKFVNEAIARNLCVTQYLWMLLQTKMLRVYMRSFEKKLQLLSATKLGFIWI